MGLTERLARACSRHPWRTLAVWIALVVVSIGAVATILNELTTDASVTNNPDSERANRLLDEHFPFDPATIPSDVVLVRSPRYTVEQPAFYRFVTGLGLARYTSANLQNLDVPTSRDKHAILIPIRVATDDDIKPVVDLVERADANPGFVVAVTGDHTVANDFNTLSEDDLRNGELRFGLPAALIILLLVFGSVVAGVVPLLMALVSIAVAMGLVAVLSQAVDLSIFIVNMLVGMGLALGVDYSLFVVSRYREERGHRNPKEAAIAIAGATACRAVLFSGTAFVVALLGMLLVPTTIMRSLAAGAILVGIVSVLAAVTLLPALLGLLGDKVNALRLPFIGAKSIEESNPEGRFWRAIVERVLKRPALSLVISVSLLLLCAVPIFSLHVGASGVETLPDRLPAKRGFLEVQRSFPGSDTERVWVVADDTSPATLASLRRVRASMAPDRHFGPARIARSEDGAISVLLAPVRGDAVGEEVVAAVRRLRSTVVPAAFAGTGTKALVTGKTAENIDYFDATTNAAPYVLAFVLGLTLILLTIAFRSIVIAAKAIVLNLLSVGAAYGLLVLVSLHGFGAGLLGFQQVDVVDAWVPLFLFSVLFGLSMDYQVFLLSRIRERYDQSGDTRDAVAWGVASTARIITGAALIIVAVFAGFAMGDLVMFQQMGFGVAVALLIDATVIRSVVLPSAMVLLGRWNWYLPSWLQWLPRVSVEAPPATDPTG